MPPVLLGCSHWSRCSRRVPGPTRVGLLLVLIVAAASLSPPRHGSNSERFLASVSGATQNLATSRCRMPPASGTSFSAGWPGRIPKAMRSSGGRVPTDGRGVAAIEPCFDAAQKAPNRVGSKMLTVMSGASLICLDWVNYYLSVTTHKIILLLLTSVLTIMQDYVQKRKSLIFAPRAPVARMIVTWYGREH